MNEMKIFLANLLNESQDFGDANIPLFFITLAILLTALYICIAISWKNKLYINHKKDKKDNAYT